MERQSVTFFNKASTMTGGPKSSTASLSELPPSLNHQALGRVKVLSHRMSW